MNDSTIKECLVLSNNVIIELNEKNNRIILNDVNIINARYMRAKVLTLGYTIPNSITQRISADRVRLSVTANDLFVVSNIKDGLDPEHGSNAHNGGNYPWTTTVLFSLQVGF